MYSWKLKTVYCKLDILIKTKDNLLKTEDNSKQDDLLQIIAHELRSMGPMLVPLLSTRCLYLGGNEEVMGWGYIWQNISLTHRLMKMVYCKGLLQTQDDLLQTIEHELRSMGPMLLPLLATRCLYLGSWGVMGWRGTFDKHQPDPQADDMSCWPAVLPFLTTRCLYGGGVVRQANGVVGALGGYIWKMKMVYCKGLLRTQDGLLQTIEHELRSMGPKLLPLLATRCLSLGHWGVMGWRGTFDKTSAWPTGWWHVMLTCSITILDH